MKREVELHFQCDGCLKTVGFLSDRDSVETNKKKYNGTNCACGKGKWNFTKQVERTKEYPLMEELKWKH